MTEQLDPKTEPSPPSRLWDTAQRAGNMVAMSLMRRSVDTARARALLDQEHGRLEQLSRAVSRDHDDAIALSSPGDQMDGADRRVTEETSQALGARLGDRWAALERAEARLAAGTYGPRS
jgi:RNA polymerase-binding transcription factor DksA